MFGPQTDQPSEQTSDSLLAGISTGAFMKYVPYKKSMAFMNALPFEWNFSFGPKTKQPSKQVNESLLACISTDVFIKDVDIQCQI